MKKLMKPLREKSGSVVVIVVVALSVLLVMSALVVDAGSVYLAKSQLQDAADAAALAGAQVLPNSSNSITAAKELAELNGLDTASGDTIAVTPQYGGDPGLIEVVCTRTVSYTFARVLGLEGTEISARAVAIKEGTSAAFSYTVFSGSSSATLAFYGSNLYIGGSMHSNGSIAMAGSSQTITGSCEAVSDFSYSGSSLNINGSCQASTITMHGSAISVGAKITQAAPFIEMPDFSAEIIAEAEAAGRAYEGNITFNQSIKNVDTPIYVHGDLTVNGSSFTGQGMIVVSGSITFNGSNVSSSSSTSVCFYSMNGNITVNGSGATLDGMVYAPNGSIVMNGSNQTINGRVIGNTIDFRGSNIQIISGTDDLNVLPTSSVTLVE